jgi:hypothetical protein
MDKWNREQEVQRKDSRGVAKRREIKRRRILCDKEG